MYIYINFALGENISLFRIVRFIVNRDVTRLEPPFQVKGHEQLLNNLLVTLVVNRNRALNCDWSPSHILVRTFRVKLACV